MKKGMEAPETLIKMVLFILGIALIIGIIILIVSGIGESQSFQAATDFRRLVPFN